MRELIRAHEGAIMWIAGLSVLAFVATLIAVPWLILRLPPDYFAHGRRPRSEGPRRHPVVHAAFLIAKNLLGYVLILAGIAMLFLPGQGILTILLGIILVDLPGKYRLERWAVSHPAVRAAINRLRRRAGREPLLFDE